jgi:hypothetical protein
MENERLPNVRLDVRFIEYGYQADIFIEGKQVSSQCRDFAKDYPISMLNDKMLESITNAVSEFRQRIVKSD